MVPIHEEKKVRDMNVYANYSTDLGGGYLVEVDGVTLFHMGDHANGEDDLMEAFTHEIDLIAERNDLSSKSQGKEPARRVRIYR